MYHVNIRQMVNKHHILASGTVMSPAMLCLLITHCHYKIMS